MPDAFFDTITMKSDTFLHSLPCSLYAALSWLMSGFAVPFDKSRLLMNSIRFAICSRAPTTLTEKDFDALLPAASLAEQLTVVLPTGNTLPEAGSQRSEVTPTLSVTAGSKVTTAPLGLVALTVIAPARAERAAAPNTGASTSSTVIFCTAEA